MSLSLKCSSLNCLCVNYDQKDDADHICFCSHPKFQHALPSGFFYFLSSLSAQCTCLPFTILYRCISLFISFNSSCHFFFCFFHKRFKTLKILSLVRVLLFCCMFTPSLFLIHCYFILFMLCGYGKKEEKGEIGDGDR